MKQVVSTPAAPAAVGPYSQAIRAGNLIFVSGQIPLTAAGDLVEGGIRPQTEQVLKNLSEILKAAGSGLDRVVRTGCFLRDMGDFADFNEIYSGFFPSEPPARACVEVACLPKNVAVEVEAVALA